jgi:NitT/TauT family transport system substrate-binding protein
MQTLHDRRSFLAKLSSASVAGVLAGLSLEKVGLGADYSFAQDGPLETTTIRLQKVAFCGATPYPDIADELLRAEGFTEIQHVAFSDTDTSNIPAALRSPLARGELGCIGISGLPSREASLTSPLARGELDLAMVYAPAIIVGIDSGAPVTVVAGVHGGCYAVLAHEGIRSIRDLKGKRVGLGVQKELFDSVAAYIGLDPAKDIEYVRSPSFDAMKELFIEHKIDALLAVPPILQELRARKIGHVILDSARDRPWSQLFCCVWAGNREFVRTRPVATKRALRAFLKAADFCVSDPAAVARRKVDEGISGGSSNKFDYAVQALREIAYKWREFDPEDSIRFYALRLREAGMINSVPAKILASGTDWRFLNDLKRELA